MQLVRPFSAVRLRQLYELTKPRVVSLIVFCAVIGMFLAVPAGSWVPLDILLAATVGIALVAGAAAAVNCLVERGRRRRTRADRCRRQADLGETLVFAGVVGGMASALYSIVNPLPCGSSARSWATQSSIRSC
jgi:protoheme IX farnesyltransferase